MTAPSAPPEALSGTPVLVSGCAGDTRRYRAWHAAEAMALAGRPIRVRTVEADPPDPGDLADAPVLILHRVAWHPDVDGWIAAVRAGGGSVLYDTDDLVFLGGGAEGDGGDARWAVVAMSDAARSLATPAHYRRVLTACDGCIVSTAPLAAAVERLGVPAWVVPNAIDLELWRLSGAAIARRAGRGDALVIGYASGTPTHDRDLATCAAAVQAVLAAEPRARFRLIGPLTLDPSWRPWSDRVERVDHMPWRDLPTALADLDINLAPLVIGDAFCEAKSALKWFEAAAVAVPTVASATAAMRDAIHDGRDGFLAATPDAWRAALFALATDPDRRAAVGRAARAAVLDAHLTDVRGPAWLAAIDGLVRRSSVGRRPVGVAAAVDVARAATFAALSDAAAGAAVDAAADAAADGAVGVARLVESDAAADAALGAAIDAALAGAPPPAPVLLLGDDPTVARGPMGAEAMAAARALEAAQRVGALGPWLAARLARRTTKSVTALPYPIDAVRFGSRAPTARRASPRPPVVLCDLGSACDSTRRLALAALHVAADTVPALAVRLFTSDAGAPPPDAGDLDRPGWRWLGALGPDERAAWFAQDAVLLAPCFGNLPPVVLEAMACGAAIAAADVPAVGWLLEDGATACLGWPQPDLLAGAIVRLVRDDGLRALVAEAGSAAVERHSMGRCRAAAASLAAGEPPSMRAPSPWTWQLDRLQPRGGDPGPPLSPGRAIGLTVVARRSGLCRIDVRVVRGDGGGEGGGGDGRDSGGGGEASLGAVRPLGRDEAARLRLTVAAGLPAVGATVLRTATAAREGRFEEWVTFRFAPLPESAGRWWTFRLSWAPDADDGGGIHAVAPPRMLGIRGSLLADAHGVVDDAPTEAWSPSFRLWAAPPTSDGALLPGGGDAALADALDLAAAEAAERQRTEHAVANLWPMRCAAWLAGRRPLPAIDRRPWPPDAPVRVKAWGTLRRYGPLALAREVRAMARWRRLDETARASLADAAACEPPEPRDQNTA